MNCEKTQPHAAHYWEPFGYDYTWPSHCGGVSESAHCGDTRPHLDHGWWPFGHPDDLRLCNGSGFSSNPRIGAEGFHDGDYDPNEGEDMTSVNLARHPHEGCSECTCADPPSSRGWLGAYTMPVPMMDNGYVAVAAEAARMPAGEVRKGDVLVLDGFVTYVTQTPEAMLGPDGRSYVHFSGPINIARHPHELLSVLRENKKEDDE